MAIHQGMCEVFKVRLLQGQFALTDTFKIALITEADLGPGTTEYTAFGELVGAGYTAGGAVLTNAVVIVGAAGGASLTFDDPVWASISGTIRGALVYNASRGNYAMAALDFGGPRTLASRRLQLNIPDGFIGLT